MNEFSQYIKLIGKGKKSGKYLTQEQANDAFHLLLTGQAEPEQVGAFLMLLRVREESEQELAGFVQAAREYSPLAIQQINADLDMGCYAGKRRHLPWFILAMLCLAQSGKRIFLHGCKEPDSNRLYLPDVFNALNIPISQTAEQAKAQLDKTGFAYMDLQQVNPQLNKLIQMRSLFGLRSPANTLARMLNPTSAPFSFHGVYHRHFDERHINVAKLLGDKHVSCIRGEGGEVEVNPERGFIQHLIHNDVISELEFPTLLPNWQIKPRSLTPDELRQCWTGELQFEYGQQAIIGTIACYLTLLDSIDVEQALTKAKQMWAERNTQFEF
ncbi:glycosyl transferase family protein [uncultured Psychrosphaera sp.]|uniref:glycosyl transferase family protein n=1 Tax=uncultured Psychrosphaera sp. TaxID=1403522 RepID=UPI0030FCB364